MFKRILIANRGEIACRVIRTLKRMGIESVAVYSDADEDALHVDLADHSVRIGPAPSVESYLRADRIVQAALDTGAEAIHPGYGFLSENPEFVRSCDRAGLTFIGPGADAIEAMGLKDAAKQLMQSAGVPVVPGYHGQNQNPEFLAGEADQIGYPVLIKARAGGGGKGMRKVESASEFHAALEGAKREASASFGDDQMLIEKYLATPRHIEIQVFADQLGSTLHLFERDCSLQRRHQKVIEEAPAPGMAQEMRSAMGNAAVQAAKAVGYVGAGTVEFIVDASNGLRPDRFYFMEMNTRLQVEHPVTEGITGIDLVEWQINVAAGHPLPLQQRDLNIDGHAIEARIYAEDTESGFLPATGKLDYLTFDKSSRVDTGVRQGDLISPFYDPMIAKLIVHAKDRSAAISKLKNALCRTRISGCTSNIGFLGRLVSLTEFDSGNVQTGLIAQRQTLLLQQENPPVEVVATAALHRAGLMSGQDAPDPWTTLTCWRPWGSAVIQDQIYLRDIPIGTRLVAISARRAELIFDDSKVELALRDLCQDEIRLQINGKWVNVGFFSKHDRLDVFFEGEKWTFTIHNPLERISDSGASLDQIAAPMPGAITHVRIQAGDRVTQGDTVIVMEAMKMEHTLRAERDGVIASVTTETGNQVEAGAILATMEAEEENS